jgi:3'(2'), 5'-bisphosphate nucleotidase
MEIQSWELFDVPVKEELYFAMEGIGSFKVKINSIISNLDNLIIEAEKLPIDYKRQNYVIVGSRSHMSEETEIFFKEMKQKYGKVEVMVVGSSLKLCMVAEGKADAYPRYAPTMEWDTGAGHAIVKYAGFSVTQYNSSDNVVCY